MVHRAWLYLCILLTAALVAASSSTSPAVAQAADAIDAHVALSVALLELSVDEWRERVAVPAAVNPADRGRAAALASIAKRFKAQRDRIYRKWGSTAAAEVVFSAKHAADIEDYLEVNPQIKGHIDVLSQTLRGLTDLEESKTAPSTAGANQ